MSEHHFHDTFARRIDVGQGVAVLVFRDGPGAHEPGDLGIEHVCGRWPDEREPDGEFVKIVAPRLSPQHTVIRDGDLLTIRPSILCPDCGLHDYITDSIRGPLP